MLHDIDAGRKRIAESDPPVTTEQYLRDVLNALTLSVLTLSQNALCKLHGLTLPDDGAQRRDFNNAVNDLHTIVEAAGRARRKAGLG